MKDPLDLIHVPKTDADALTSVVKYCLIQFSLPVSQCHGQAYDRDWSPERIGCTDSEGCPPALFLHCFAHYQLVLTIHRASVCSSSACIRFSLSANPLLSQTSLFLPLQSQLSPHLTTTLKPLCPTEWTVRTAAISAVLTNYSILCNTETHDEYGLKIGGYLAQMGTFSTYFGLKLFHLVFCGAEQLSLTLKGKDTTI